MNCQICHLELLDKERVIYSHRETFVFKPADVEDTVNPAEVSPEALAESRKEHQRTAIANVFGEWGAMTVPPDAFYVRHQWCEPVRTGSGGGAHPVNKHAVRFNRSRIKRSPY